MPICDAQVVVKALIECRTVGLALCDATPLMLAPWPPGA